MKTTINLDKKTLGEIDQAADLIRERPATVTRMAIREGLAAVVKKAFATGSEWVIVKDCECKGESRPSFPVPYCAKCKKPWKLIFKADAETSQAASQDP